jgi:hypothetical protein
MAPRAAPTFTGADLGGGFAATERGAVSAGAALLDAEGPFVASPGTLVVCAVMWVAELVVLAAEASEFVAAGGEAAGVAASEDSASAAVVTSL